MEYQEWRRYFERVTTVPEVELPLAEAALILAGDQYPDLGVSRELERLNEMAGQLRRRLPGRREAHPTLAALNSFLFKELEFHGNRENYYDPRNSYLNDVLDRRVGLPITLSVLVLALAQPLELPIFGVGLPGHFILKWGDGTNEIFFDPFFGGETLDQRAIEARVREVYNPHAQFQHHWLEAVGAKYILVRMLNNLKSIFLQNRQLERAWQAVDKLLILDHRAGDEIRDFGLLSLQLGAYRQSAMYLEQYLLAHSEAPDADQMRIYLRRALDRVARLN